MYGLYHPKLKVFTVTIYRNENTLYVYMVFTLLYQKFQPFHVH